VAYTVKAFSLENINFAPQTTEEEVLQNVAMIISTPQFSVPLARGFGLSQRFVDKPVQIAKAIAVSEVMDAIEKSEPRAEVISVTFEQGDSPGKLIPVVEVKINGE